MYPLNCDFEIFWNSLSIQVRGGQIIDLDGYYSLRLENVANYKVPEHRRGSLNLYIQAGIHGIAHEINNYRGQSISDKEEPVYVMVDSGWICIGNPLITTRAVEFLPNCVAVLDNVGGFKALWLKPFSLPSRFKQNTQLIEITQQQTSKLKKFSLRKFFGFKKVLSSMGT